MLYSEDLFDLTWTAVPSFPMKKIYLGGCFAIDWNAIREVAFAEPDRCTICLKVPERCASGL